MYYQPEGFALSIFQKRHALHEHETWLDGCERVGTHVASAEEGDNVPKYRAEFTELLKRNLFMPGGRIWYGAGRAKGNCLNCFVSPTADSREGWGKTASDMIVITGTGGGLGINFSPIRPRGSDIQGTGGKATGAVSLMEIINSAGEVIKAGGGRRTALMFALGITHGDLLEFMDKKLDLKQLTNANVSVIFEEGDDPEDFFQAVKEDREWEMKFRGRVVGRVPAKVVWDKIVANALKSGEPGMLNFHLANKMSNVRYLYPLISTNPCLPPGTMVQTRDGHYPIETLVGKTVEVWDGISWVKCDNFRVTGENQNILKVTLQDGSFERMTPYHKCILEDGTRIEAKDLQPWMRLKYSEAPLTHGTVREPGAYLKGFLTGDGCANDGKAWLWLYAPKYICADRLVNSCAEMAPTGQFRSDCQKVPSFGEFSGRTKLAMQGLTSRREELLPWVTDFKMRLPSEVFAWDLKSKCEFIAGAMDADGTASDTSNGWMYQISSIEKAWLYDFQLLLKTIGVRSKLSLMKKEGQKDFGSRGGVCTTQDCWRLTISQEASITLAQAVTFERLASFAKKETSYKLSPRANKIVSVEPDGVEEKVYCCTIESTHAFSLSSGILLGQCGEICLPAYGCCCLGALVLPRFVRGKSLDWDLLKQTVATSVRFLDNVLTVNNYPLPEIKEVCSGERRIGLGVMGLSTMLLMLGKKYNAPDSLEFVDKVISTIKNTAYEASIDIAKEKGPFARFEAEPFLKSGFCKTLKPTIRARIREHGIRNCALLTIAPTGTTAIECDVDSGIEPSFGPAWIRTFRDGDELKKEIVIHPLFKKMYLAGEDVSHFQTVYDLKMRDHFEMQKVCQRHIDNAVSKTVNVPPGTSAAELSALYMEFFPELKGVTVYPEGSRENQPITPLSTEEAIKHIHSTVEAEGLSGDACKNGVCEI